MVRSLWGRAHLSGRRYPGHWRRAGLRPKGCAAERGMRMKRTGVLGVVGVLAVTVGVLLSALSAAGASTKVLSGVVLAKNAKRQTLVVASAGGIVQTLHVRSLRGSVGSRVTARVSRLHDGTFRVSNLSLH